MKGLDLYLRLQKIKLFGDVEVHVIFFPYFDIKIIY